MEITGTLSRILPLVTGQGRNGEWRKQEFVIDIEAGNFPKKVCFSLWGDKIGQVSLREGAVIKVFFDLESREYNGRYFTEARAWKIENVESAAPVSESSAHAAPFANTPDFTTEVNDASADDLPF